MDAISNIDWIIFRCLSSMYYLPLSFQRIDHIYQESLRQKGMADNGNKENKINLDFVNKQSLLSVQSMFTIYIYRDIQWHTKLFVVH